MLKLSGVLLLVLISFQAHTQRNGDIERLQLEFLQDHPDSSKVRILNALSDAYLRVNLDTAIYYAQEASELALSLGRENWKSLFLIAQANGLKGNKRQTLDQLNALAKNEKNYSLSDSDYRDIFYETGWVHRELGNNDSALINFKKSLKISTQLDDTSIMEADLYMISNVYLDLGQYKRALEGFHQCIDYAQMMEIEDKYPKICALHNDIARVYVFIEDFDKAEEYFLQAYQMSIDYKLTTIHQVSLNNLGFIKKEKGEFDEALEFFHRALGFRDNDVCRTPYPLYNIGNILRQRKQYDSAQYYLNTSLTLADSCSDTYIQTLIKIDQGELALETGKLQNAKNYLLSALEISRRSGLITEERNIHYALSNVYEKLDDYVKAFTAFKNYEQIKDSLFNESKARELERLENTYLFEKKQQAERLQRQMTDLAKEEALDQAISSRNYFILGFIIMLLIALFSYISVIRKKSANKILSKLNAEIKYQKEELLAQAENLKKLNEEMVKINGTLEKRVTERTKIIEEQREKIVDYMMYNSHEVRSPIARVMGLISLFDTNVLTKEEAMASLKNVKKSVEELDEKIKTMSLKLEQEKKLMAKN